MKKLGIISIFLSLLLVFSMGIVSSSPLDATFSLSNPSNPSGVQGETVTITFEVENTGANDLDLEFDTTSTTTSWLNGINIDNLPLAAGTTETVSFDATISTSATIGSKTGTINANEVGNPGNSATLDFSVSVVEENLDIEVYEESNLNDIIEEGDDMKISGPQDSYVEEDYTIKNLGNVDLENFQLVLTGDFSDNDDDDLTFDMKIGSGSYSSITLGQPKIIGDLDEGSTITITLKTYIPDNMDIDTYSGEFNLSGESTISGDSVSYYNDNFKVLVEPDICDDEGIIGDLEIDISNPDNNDDFKINDNIEIDVDVKNNGNDNIDDVIVEAILYNLDTNKEITSIQSEPQDIEEEGEEDEVNYDFELSVPIDEDLENDNDNYVLYLKVYEDGNEDEQCNYESIEMNLDLDNDDVAVTTFTINPSTVNPGQIVYFTIEVKNIGSNNQDEVYVKLENTLLGLNMESSKISLDEFGKSDDNYNFGGLFFTVPTNANANDYTILVTPYFDGKSGSPVSGTLTVTGESTGSPVISGDASLSLLQTSISATSGKVFAIPFTVSNTGSSSATYTVEATPLGGWADSVSETITVNAGETNTGYAYLTPYSSTSAGSYTATVTLKQNGNTLESSSVSVNVAADTGATGSVTYQPAGVLSDLTGSTWFWVIGNIVLVILVVLILFLIFRKR